MNTPQMTVCPSCGSDKIKRVCRDRSVEFQGQSYTLPSLEFYACPVFSDKVCNRQAMREIKEHSPAFDKAHAAH